MTAIPEAAVDAAWDAICDSAGGALSTMKTVEAAILAALPHLGEPVAWLAQSKEHGGRLVRLASLKHLLTQEANSLYDEGYDLLPLFLAPPAPAVIMDVKPLWWEPIDFATWAAVGGGIDYQIECESGVFWLNGVGHPSLSAAQTAAQMDLDHRIRLALVVQTTPATSAIPAGWKLVPIDPSIEIIEAGAKAMIAAEGLVPTKADNWRALAAYRAMLAAVPEPPATEEPTVDEVKKNMAEALRGCNCPHPAGGRPDNFTVGQCLRAGECGCSDGAALAAYEKEAANAPA